MNRARNAAAAVLVVMTMSVMPAADAQPLGDLVDLTCGPTIAGPFAGTGAHEVTATGSYACATIRPSIGVIVCLQYNGVTVNCGQDVRTNARRAEATARFVCLPGVWTATALGVTTGGLPGGAAGVAVPLDCDPLRP